MLDQEEKLPVQEEKLSSENSETAEEQKSTIQPTLEKNTSTNVAVDEIESKIAESSENTEHPAIEMEDYGKLSLDDLVEELGKLVREGQVQSINNNVNKIKSIFNVKFGKLLKAEKEKFLAEGGNVVDFQYSNPIKSTYNSILYDFKIKRNEFYSNQEAKLKTNLEKFGFAHFCGLHAWEVLKDLKDVSKDFSELVTRIEQLIYNQKLEGASVGAFNSSIIASDLGLKNRNEKS